MRELTEDEIDMVSGGDIGNIIRDIYTGAGALLGQTFGGSFGAFAGAVIGGATYDAQSFTATRGAAGGWGCAKLGNCAYINAD